MTPPRAEMNLELIAMRWLRFERRHDLVLYQRSPRYQIGVPDVLGITRSRYMTEVEVKRSLTDFRLDMEKAHIQNRLFLMGKLPRHKYYLISDELNLKRADEICPSWAGLLVQHSNGYLHVRKKSPGNAAAERLTPKECLRLVKLVANQIVSLATLNETLLNRRWPEPYFPTDYEI